MGLQIWLPLNGDLTNQGIDKTVTITNGGATVNTEGKIGKCYAFDGTQYIKVQSTYLKSYLSSSTVPFSMACWIYLNSDETDRVIIFGNYNSNPFVNWELLGSGVQRLCAGGTSNYTSVGGGTATPAITWTHLAVTYDGAKTTCYMNGKQIYTASGANTVAAVQGSDTWYLGSDVRSGATRLKGRLNDFRFYDHCLSSEEVKWISRGLVLHYSLSNRGFGGDNIIKNSWAEERTYTYPSSSYSDKFSPITTIVPSASKYTLSFYAKSTVNRDKIRTHYYSPNTTTTCVSSQGITKTASDGNMDFTLSTSWKRYWVTYTQNETTAVKHVICPRLVSGQGTGTISIRGIKFEEGEKATPWIPNSDDALYSLFQLDSTTEFDCSGYQHNGEKHGTISYDYIDTPLHHCCTHLMSTSSYIKIDGLNTSGFGNTYTFSWWAKVNSVTPMHWGFSNGVRLNGMYTGHLWNTGDSSDNPLYKPGTTTQVTNPTINVWHHWVMTGDGTTCKVYQDGELFGVAKTYKPISGTTIYINGWDASTSYSASDLRMSDFRLYATALDENAIKELYMMGGGVV